MALILPTITTNSTTTLDLSVANLSMAGTLEFMFSGTFGGGTLTLKRAYNSVVVPFGQSWDNPNSPVALTQPVAGLNLDNLPREGQLQFVLSGATSPSIVITVLGANLNA